MKNIRVTIAAALFALLPAGAAIAEELSTQRTDLTFANLSSAGWDEPWAKRSRTDYFAQRPLGTSSDREIQFLGEPVESSFNRRLMLAALGNFQWIDSRRGEDESGGTYGALTRLQVVDTAHASSALNLRVVAPNEGLGATHARRVFAPLTPGARCNLERHHVLMAGLKVPVTTPRAFEHTFRFTYMYSF